MTWQKILNAIERVLDKRSKRGASDKSLINWLEHLKIIYYGKYRDLDMLIDAIEQTPLNR